MLELCFLGSGSRGNALMVGWDQTRLLLDCGFTARELKRRAASLGRDLDQVEAVLITHEHRDHVAGLAGLAAKADRAVYCMPKTARAVTFGKRCKAERHELVPGRSFAVGPIEVCAFRTSHDARDPVGFVFAFPDGTRLGVATDLGYLNPEAAEALAGCDYLGLESNHDLDLLRDGPYPWVLKQRIRSDRGHLSNPTAADALDRLASDRLRQLFALHLSQTNNTPQHARTSLQARMDRLGLAAGLQVIGQDQPTRFGVNGQLRLL
jgi:phosphoribosyl 1,2-cyclic phosphodiesterase